MTLCLLSARLKITNVQVTVIISSLVFIKHFVIIGIKNHIHLFYFIKNFIIHFFFFSYRYYPATASLSLLSIWIQKILTNVNSILIISGFESEDQMIIFFFFMMANQFCDILSWLFIFFNKKKQISKQACSL